MDAAVVEQNPHEECTYKVREHLLLADVAQQEGEGHHDERDAEQREIDVPAVEESNHQDGNEVIRNGQGGKEDLH